MNLYYLVYCQHPHLAIGNLSRLGKQPGYRNPLFLGGKAFALEMLGAVRRMPRKTVRDNTALEARKKEKKLRPIGARSLLPHRPDGEG